MCLEDNPTSTKTKLTESKPRTSKAIIARTLCVSRGSLYYQSRLEWKDKKVAVEIERIHDEEDDTLGHKKLAPLLKTGKNRVKRIMHKYALSARKRSKKYVYRGKSDTIQPNLANQEVYRESLEAGIVYSDIFEFRLGDGCILRGCFALLKQTRQILSLVFDYSMKATLVQAAINIAEFPEEVVIWHSDQGKQFGAGQTLALVLEKGLRASMSRAGTPTDNPFAERFVGTFKHAVVRKRTYYTLGEFLHVAEKWINFYNNTRPHEGINNLSPNNYAKKYGWPTVPYLANLTV